MLEGITGFETVVVKPASVYQVTTPELQVADKEELCPEQIVVGLAEIPFGDDGVGFTLMVTFPASLLQPLVLTHAT
ncbi:hypothetical protein MCERE19_01184 [Spirosomataceae bacterium]